MNVLLMLGGGILFVAGVLTSKKDSGNVRVSEAKTMPTVENVENEQKRDNSQTSVTSDGGRDNSPDLESASNQTE
tara:strand:+ start:259 stop:483 length:225 start_codon:yes stop_codon:yes gene_type:complete